MNQERRYVDVETIWDLSKEIEDQFMGKGIKRPLTDILKQIRAYGPFADEFLSDLEELHARGPGHNKSVSSYVQAALGLTTRIRIRASHWNSGTKLVEEREKLFRIEIREPLYTDSSPVIFYASVYISESFFTTVRCCVYDEDIEHIILSNKSLSKRRARERRLNAEWNGFLMNFPLHLERLWKAGQDLTDVREITWSDVRKRF